MRPGRLLLLTLVLVLAFNLPTSLAALASIRTWAVPLELAVAALLVLLLPASQILVRRVLAAVLAFLVLLQFTELAVGETMGRPLLLVFDLPLALSLLEVATSASLPVRTMLLAVAILLLSIPLYLLCSAFLTCLSRLGHRRGLAAGLALVLVTASGVRLAGAALGRDWPVMSTQGIDEAAAQVRRTIDAREAAARWVAQDASDPVAELMGPGLLARLRDVDVIVLFVESYGRSTIERAPFAGPVRTRLDAMTVSLERHGLLSASGWLLSPTIGGQSWLPHATLASGIRTADQGSYGVYLERVHADLAHLFAAAGHVTADVQPAIIHPFPEADRLGFQRHLFAADLGYRGQPFGWVTMPDQYTLAAMERALRRGSPPARPPVYVQAALIGSHAPFTPRPSGLLAWDRIGDGTAFDRLPREGDTAAVTWSTTEGIRTAYTAAILHDLDVLDSYASTFVSRQTILVVIGDHEPASLISGTDSERAVPIHVISGDPALLAPFRAWGLTPGMVPAATSAEHPIEDVRAFLVRAFSLSPGTIPSS